MQDQEADGFDEEEESAVSSSKDVSLIFRSKFHHQSSVISYRTVKHEQVTALMPEQP